VVKRSLIVVAVLISLAPCRAPAQQAGSRSRKMANKVVPLYPDLARRLNPQGTVKLEGTVPANGNVKSVRGRGRQPGAGRGRR